MTAIFFDNAPVITLSSQDMETLKEKAQTAPLRRARYCLHHTEDDPVQEMVIAFCADSEVPVHRHMNKSESFHVISGELEIIFHDDEGKETRRILMGEPKSGLPFVYRLAAPMWHTVRPLSDFVVIHEVTTGPFVQGDMEVLGKEGA